jgi:thioredoxin 1
MLSYFQNLVSGYTFQYSHLAILVGVLLALYFLWGYMRKPSGPNSGVWQGPNPYGSNGPNPGYPGRPGMPGPNPGSMQGPPGGPQGNIQYDQALPPMPNPNVGVPSRYPNDGGQGLGQGQDSQTCSPPMDHVNQGTNNPGPTLGPGSQGTSGNQMGGNSNRTLVLYYAPWCAFCKKIMPSWDDLQNRYGERVQKVDCEAYPEEAEKQNIEAFPTVILFVDNKKVKVLKGGADPETLESFLA